MGTDSRSGEGNGIDGEAGGGLSDTTILFHLSADREYAYGISIPRDTAVVRPTCYREDGSEIPGSGGYVKWNEAFASGGPACTTRQVEQAEWGPDRPLRGRGLQPVQGHGQRPRRRRGLHPRGHRRPQARRPPQGGHARDQGQGGADLRPRPLPDRRRHRPQPDPSPAGLHRLDDQQGADGRHARAPRPADPVHERRDLLAAVRPRHRRDRRHRQHRAGHRRRQHQVRHDAVGLLRQGELRHRVDARGAEGCGAWCAATSR
ncbi:LCP family protein [Nocardioides convexus]|uniref:LCP family protein n=1 Tax=Nocardioides convexus TaxID=2712224 RepID=UPI0024183998|nr:LCP family protein [Nocardioides convexus]